MFLFLYYLLYNLDQNLSKSEMFKYKSIKKYGFKKGFKTEWL